MKFRRNAALGLATAAAAGLALLAHDSQAQAPSAGFKPVSTVHGLMNGQMLLFTQISDAVENKATQKRHEMINAYAEVLAELANVNTYNHEKEDYRKWAGELRDTAMELSKEGKKKKDADEAKMKKLVEKLKSTCDACHKQYQ